MSSEGMPEPMAKRFGYAVKRAQHALRTRMDEALRPLGLTAPQYAVLSAVELDAGISNASLARAAFVTPQTMQGILANLDRDNLLVRTADPAHRRILRSELTSRGRRVLARAHQLVSAIEAAMIAAIGVEQAEKVTSLLLCCTKALAEPADKGAAANAPRRRTPRGAVRGRADRARH
jgi:DNA-binding MarR family transcriptional regulator